MALLGLGQLLWRLEGCSVPLPGCPSFLAAWLPGTLAALPTNLTSDNLFPSREPLRPSSLPARPGPASGEPEAVPASRSSGRAGRAPPVRTSP